MTFSLKIVSLVLLMLLKYQGGETGCVTSVADRCVSAMLVEAQENTREQYATFNADLWGNSLFIVSQQISVKIAPDFSLRIRRATEIEQNFLRDLIGHFSLREEILATKRAKLFPSNPAHCVSPACHYFVFMLRRILI